MDRPDTLARLDKLIDPAGAVVLFATSHPDDPPTPWFTQYRALLEEYAQSDPARVQRQADDWESHDSVLLKSPFASLERVSIVEMRRVAVESLLARARRAGFIGCVPRRRRASASWSLSLRPSRLHTSRLHAVTCRLACHS